MAPMSEGEWITTEEAARIIGVTRSQVRYLLHKGVLKGQRFGYMWMVDKESAERYAVSDRKPGPKPRRISS